MDQKTDDTARDHKMVAAIYFIEAVEQMGVDAAIQFFGVSRSQILRCLREESCRQVYEVAAELWLEKKELQRDRTLLLVHPKGKQVNLLKDMLDGLSIHYSALSI